MRLRFCDQNHRCFYEGGGSLPGIDVAVTEHLLDAFAVLVAAQSVADFEGLVAFPTSLLDPGPPERRVMSLGMDWKLIFRVEGNDSGGAVATIESFGMKHPRNIRRSR